MDELALREWLELVREEADQLDSPVLEQAERTWEEMRSDDTEEP
ncbi:MAG TPA: hypothetical protein VFQ60_00830 [Patescibacteria group bacterium]|nr:hypothetical protein [Patescibacteria group bacterium]